MNLDEIDIKSEVNDVGEFSDIFGNFIPEAIDEDKSPIANVERLTPREAQPCRDCGDQPAVHLVNFKDKAAHPKPWYICCSHCSACDGEWYATREEAVAEWNRLNLGSIPRDMTKEDGQDFIHKVMEDFKIPL
jgi:hypothetical protein